MAENSGIPPAQGDDTPNSFASAVAELDEETAGTLSGANQATVDDEISPLSGCRLVFGDTPVHNVDNEFDDEETPFYIKESTVPHNTN